MLRICTVWELPSVLWCCWLGSRKGMQPVKNMEWWGAGVVVCLEQAANDLHMVQLMPLPPHHLLLQQNPGWFILLVPAYPGCPGKKAVKCLCVCVLYCMRSGQLVTLWLILCHLFCAVFRSQIEHELNKRQRIEQERDAYVSCLLLLLHSVSVCQMLVKLLLHLFVECEHVCIWKILGWCVMHTP